MPLTLTRTRIKQKCGITDSSQDAAIDALIAELIPVIEQTISEDSLADAALEATLNLGAAEIVCGELLAQMQRLDNLPRPEGSCGCTYRCYDPSDPSRLIAKGWRLLRPYLKVDPPFSVAGGVRSGSRLKEIPPVEG